MKPRKPKQIKVWARFEKGNVHTCEIHPVREPPPASVSSIKNVARRGKP